MQTPFKRSTRATFRVAVLCASAILAGCSTADSSHVSAVPPKQSLQWEYRFESSQVDRAGSLFHAEAVLRSALENAGRDGWELVTLSLLDAAPGDVTSKPRLLAILKRPLSRK